MMDRKRVAAELVRLAKKLSARDDKFEASQRTANTWSKAVNKFETGYQDVWKKVQAQAAKMAERDVSKLFEQMKNDLPGYDFVRGMTAQQAAKALLEEMTSESGSDDPQWTFDNFFRQGYAGLERVE